MSALGLLAITCTNFMKLIFHLFQVLKFLYVLNIALPRSVPHSVNSVSLCRTQLCSYIQIVSISFLVSTAFSSHV